MSEHKRCSACGRIEETILRLECEARAASIERVIQSQRRMGRLQETNREVDAYEQGEVS